MSAPERAGTFRRAAHIIRTGGLAKGAFVNADGEHCTAGAVMAAKGLEMVDVEGARSEIGYLVDLLGGSDGKFHPVFAVARWSDTEGRTAEDVATLLEQAAEKLEADQ